MSTEIVAASSIVAASICSFLIRDGVAFSVIPGQVGDWRIIAEAGADRLGKILAISQEKLTPVIASSEAISFDAGDSTTAKRLARRLAQERLGVAFYHGAKWEQKGDLWLLTGYRSGKNGAVELTSSACGWSLEWR